MVIGQQNGITMSLARICPSAFAPVLLCSLPVHIHYYLSGNVTHCACASRPDGGIVIAPKMARHAHSRTSSMLVRAIDFTGQHKACQSMHCHKKFTGQHTAYHCQEIHTLVASESDTIQVLQCICCGQQAAGFPGCFFSISDCMCCQQGMLCYHLWTASLQGIVLIPLA